MSDCDVLEFLADICIFPVIYLGVTQGNLCITCVALVLRDCSEVASVSPTRTDDNWFQALDICGTLVFKSAFLGNPLYSNCTFGD